MKVLAASAYLTRTTHLVFDVVEVRHEVFLSTMQETLRLQISSTESQEVDSGQSGLLAGGDKHYDGEFGRVLADGVVDGFYHGNETRGGVGDGEALDVEL